jgi:hypothetical protein
MIRHYFNTLLLAVVFLCFQRCAQVAPLTGGVRDTTPPKLIEAIPSVPSINFNSNEILLRFDEYVQLKDLKNQLLVSPSLKTEPEVTADGKKIRMVLKKEELQPNTTYRIYFGKAIADMTEGNPIANFEYVFSTGTYIDSLKVSGIIKDAFTETNVADVLVGLFESRNFSDSMVYKKKPDYITRSVASGSYAFEHLPAKPFRVIAFTDKNKNYIYDGETEKIGFANTELLLNSDTSVNISIFQELPARTYIKKTVSPYYGLLNIIYNQKSVFKIQPLFLQASGAIRETSAGAEKDTITVVYDGMKDSLGLIVQDVISKKYDTVKINLPKLNLSRKKSLSLTSNLNGGVLPINIPFQFSFLNSIDTLKTNPAKVYLTYAKDSVRKEEPAVIRYNWPLQAELMNSLTEGTEYKLQIDTAAFYDLNGRYNDSLVLKFKRQAKTELGHVTLKVLLNKKQSYIIQLINEKGIVSREENISLSLSSSNAVSIDFTGITPGIYTVKVVFDNNENKKWDTGNFMRHKQAENVFISSKQVKVIPDWDVEEEILVK